MAIEIKNYEINDNFLMTSVPNKVTGQSTSAYYIKDRYFSNLSLTDCKKILEDSIVIGNSLGNYASPLFSDDTNFFILQNQWSARYNYPSPDQNGGESLFLRQVVLSNLSPTKPTQGAYIKLKSGKYATVTLGDKASSYPVNLSSSYSAPKSRLLEESDIYNQDNETAYIAFQDQVGKPDAIMFLGILDSSTPSNDGVDSVKVKSGWQYINQLNYTFNTSDDAYYYHVKSSVDPAKTGLSYAKLAYKGSIANLSCFEKSKQNYFVSSMQDSYWSKGKPIIIDKTAQNYDPNNPFGLADKEAVILQIATKNMHGKKLYLEGGSESDYVVLFHKAIDKNLGDGDGTWSFKIPSGSTLQERDLLNDSVLVDKDNDAFFASLPSNNEPVKILDLDIPSRFVVKQQSKIGTEGSGYSNLIYFEDFDIDQSIVLVQSFPKDQVLLNQYQWYIFLQAYNVTSNLYKTLPTLQENNINAIKYNFTLQKWELNNTAFAQDTFNLPDGFGDNLLNNSYVNEIDQNPTKFSFTPKASFELDEIPFIAIFQDTNNNAQFLNGECYVLACYDESINLTSFTTTDTTAAKIGNRVNLILKP
jgi:hypothetical protein